MNYEPQDYSDFNDISTEATRYTQPHTHALLDFSRLDGDLQEIYLTLSGLSHDSENDTLHQSNKPMLNQEGVQALMLAIRAYFSRSATFGKMKADGICILVMWKLL